MTEIQQHVARGVAFLDQDRPDWWARVNPEAITTICGFHGCVLWNVYPNGVLPQFKEIPLSLTLHGFCCLPEQDAAYVAEWRRVIAERRARVSPEPAMSTLEKVSIAVTSVLLAVALWVSP